MLGLILYYEDLFDYKKMALEYADMAKLAIRSVDSVMFQVTSNMWFLKYSELMNYKWYQKLFYKRES